VTPFFTVLAACLVYLVAALPSILLETTMVFIIEEAAACTVFSAYISWT
jgi:hypothetical protein